MHVSAQPGALHVISTQYMLNGLFTIMISTSNAFLHVSEPTHYSVVSSDGYLSTGSGQKPESFLTLVMG